jgi:hypothetical protein
MIYDFREYSDHEIPNFVWFTSGSDLIARVIIGADEINIKAIVKDDLWKITAKKKNGVKIMNLRVRNLTKEEVMIITETNLLDRYND